MPGGLARLLEAGLRGSIIDSIGPAGYRLVVAARKLAIAAAGPAAFAALQTAGIPAAAAVLAVAATVFAGAHLLYRSLVGSGVDRELPALLAYLIPFSYSAASVAAVIAALAGAGPPFRWVSREAERLKALLDSGADPVAALERLATTTPSRRLRDSLRAVTAAVKAGAPRSFIVQRVLDHALEAIRGSWASYTAMARVAAEASAALAVLAATLAPAAALASLNPSWLAASAVLPLAAAAALVAAKPPLGGPGSGAPSYFPLAVAGASVAAAITGAPVAWVAAGLAVATAMVEAWGFITSSRWRAAWTRLLEALAKARAGLLDVQALEEAEAAAPGVARALAKAARVAGRSGLAGVIDSLAGALLEASRLARAASVQAIVMAAVCIAAAAAGAYAVDAVQSIASGSQLLNPAALAAMPRVMAALAIATPLPAAAAARPHAPSLAPSLAALLAVEMVLG